MTAADAALGLGIIAALLFMVCSDDLLHTLTLWLRHRTIREQGWPPAHCDADGEPVVDPDGD